MSSLVLKVDVGPGKRILVNAAASIPLELVSPQHSEAAKKFGTALLDTGAELTLVKERILRELEALPHSPACISGIHEEVIFTHKYLVDLHFVFEDQIAWTVKRLEVAPLKNSASVDFLIGMDVLTAHVREFSLAGGKAIIQF